MKQILHICKDGKKENVAPQVSVGFAYCPWCGVKYVVESNTTTKLILKTKTFKELAEKTKVEKCPECGTPFYLHTHCTHCHKRGI